MTIVKEILGSTLKVVLKGRLDTVTSPELEKELKDKLEGVETLVFDLGDLEYVSSAGLRVLITNHKIMMNQGKMVITNCPDEVMEVFEITGFIDVFNIE